ncbi:hypothetical protein BDZ89DRAFT_1146342 [Hymenopellis radicata]|nr:hypothetical protein BDZ89DRAFT_1146342 [Hymenopellis radicata]
MSKSSRAPQAPLTRLSAHHPNLLDVVTGRDRRTLPPTTITKRRQRNLEPTLDNGSGGESAFASLFSTTTAGPPFNLCDLSTIASHCCSRPSGHHAPTFVQTVTNVHAGTPLSTIVVLRLLHLPIVQPSALTTITNEVHTRNGENILANEGGGHSVPSFASHDFSLPALIASPDVSTFHTVSRPISLPGLDVVSDPPFDARVFPLTRAPAFDVDRLFDAGLRLFKALFDHDV